mgnify:CR=1 FL=1
MTTTTEMKYDKDRCLTFWYYEDGQNPFEISVSRINKDKEELTSQYKSQIESRKKWTMLKIDLQLPNYEVGSDESKFVRKTP